MLRVRRRGSIGIDELSAAKEAWCTQKVVRQGGDICRRVDAMPIRLEKCTRENTLSERLE